MSRSLIRRRSRRPSAGAPAAGAWSWQWQGGAAGICCAVTLLYAFTYAVLLIRVRLGGPAPDWISWPLDLPLGLATVGFAGLAARAARGEPARQLAWLLLAGANACYMIANGVWAWLQAVGYNDPFPSPADLLFAGFYVLATAAIVILLRNGRLQRPGLRFWLDTATVVVGFGALTWIHVITPGMAATGHGALESLLSIVYPAADCALLILAALLLLRPAPDGRNAGSLWLAAAIGMLMLADLMWIRAQIDGVYTMGSTPELLYLACYALFAVSGCVASLEMGSPPRARASRAWRRLGRLLPSAAFGVAIIVVLQVNGAASLEAAPLAMLATALLGMLVAGRLVLAAVEVMREQAVEASRTVERRYAALSRNSSDVLMILDEAAGVKFVTPSCEDLFGAAEQELLGRCIALRLRPGEEDRFAALLAAVCTASEPRRGEFHLLDAQGRLRTIEVVATDHRDDPLIEGIIVACRDTTERRSLEERLRQLAFHDPLTLLANRALFRDRLQHGLDVARREDRRVAVIFVDLDDFKKVNDSLGHDEGDRLLIAVTRRLADCTRPSDTLARLGGDEFAILIEGAHAANAAVELARRIAERLAEPLELSAGEIRISASVGIVAGGSGDSDEDLLRNADLAMYHAKARGKGQFAVFEPHMQAAARERLRIEADLARALRRDELFLQYQPIVDLGTGRVVGVEALLRWRHPQRGVLLPGSFIDVAESSGLIVSIGQWVLQTACAELAAWRRSAAGLARLRLAVNVSSLQLQRADLVGHVRDALVATDVAPEDLVLELTESAIMQGTDTNLDRLRQLKALGIDLAIDDFGTGYSSLSYLHRFPIDILKIDRSFVGRIVEGEGGPELARAVVTLGDTLGLTAIAEGIETPEQVEMLLALGCRTGQGYLFGRPGSLRDVVDASHAARRQPDTPGGTVAATGRFLRPAPPIAGFDATSGS